VCVISYAVTATVVAPTKMRAPFVSVA
jgi:hypothetical protein